MRHNPKSKPNAGRRLEWDAKKGKSVQKPGRPKANKAPTNMDLMDKTKDQLVRMGTPAAKAELKRRGRDPKGTKMAWSAGAKKPARRGARRNPEVSALGNPYFRDELEKNGRFFIRMPYNVIPTQDMINAMPPAVIYFVGRGKALDRKSNLVLATYDYRAGSFGDPAAMIDVLTVRSEDEAMEKLRSKSYPKGKKEMFSAPYNLFQVTHSGEALTLPTLLDGSRFELDLLRKMYPELRKEDASDARLTGAYPYAYPDEVKHSPRNRALSSEQIVWNIYNTSGRDPSVPWRDAGPAGDETRKRAIVTEYAGKKSLGPIQEANYVEGNPEKDPKAKVLGEFGEAKLKYALQGIADTLSAENSRVPAGMIEFCVLDEKIIGDIRVVVALWKLVGDEWAAWSQKAVKEQKDMAGAGEYRGYPPVQGSDYMARPAARAVGAATPPPTASPNPAHRRRQRMLHNPMEEIEIDEEEALSNPFRSRRRSRRR